MSDKVSQLLSRIFAAVEVDKRSAKFDTAEEVKVVSAEKVKVAADSEVSMPKLKQRAVESRRIPLSCLRRSLQPEVQ